MKRLVCILAIVGLLILSTSILFTSANHLKLTVEWPDDPHGAFQIGGMQDDPHGGFQVNNDMHDDPHGA